MSFNMKYVSFFIIANSIRQRIKVLRQKYQTVANAELKFGLDVSYYIGEDSTINTKNTSQIFTLTTVNLEVFMVLTQSQKLQILKELYASLDHDGKVKCCSDVFFKGNSVVKGVVISLIQSVYANNTHISELMTLMDDAFMKLAVGNGLCSNPKYFVSNSIKAMKRLSTQNKPNLVYKFSQMLTIQKAANCMEPVIQLDRMPFGLLEYIIQFFTATHVNQVQFMKLYSRFNSNKSWVLRRQCEYKQSRRKCGKLPNVCEMLLTFQRDFTYVWQFTTLFILQIELLRNK